MRVERFLSDRRTLIGVLDAPRYRYIKSDTRATDIREQVTVPYTYSPGTFCVPGRLIEPRFVPAGLFGLEERKFWRIIYDGSPINRTCLLEMGYSLERHETPIEWLLDGG